MRKLLFGLALLLLLAGCGQAGTAEKPPEKAPEKVPEEMTEEMTEEMPEEAPLKESLVRLPGSYDFNHDGEPEIVELVTVVGDEEQNTVGWYELRVRIGDNRLYWGQSFAEAHPGWGTCFACRVDGEDYLLRYLPTMYQGYASYTYELFFLDGTGEEQVVREGSVNFDMNFNELHERFEPEEIAAFLEEVHGLLEDSELLLTTEGGNFRSGGPGSAFKDDLEYWTGDPLYDESKSLEENIWDIGAYWEEMRTA